MKVPAVVNVATGWEIRYITDFAEMITGRYNVGSHDRRGQFPPHWPSPNQQKQRLGHGRKTVGKCECGVAKIAVICVIW